MLAYDYPLLGVFWTMLWFFMWIVWLMLLFRVIGDVFRSHDMGGFSKALWLIFVILVPFLGVLVYVIVRGHSMSQRDVDHMKAQQSAFDSYVRETAGAGGSSAEELTKLAGLRDSGVITEAEFQQLKAKALE
jgi:type VI protein secretion system component VasK